MPPEMVPEDERTNLIPNGDQKEDYVYKETKSSAESLPYDSESTEF